MSTSTGLKLSKPTSALATLKILVYGQPGVGKTYLAGSAEDDERMAPVLYGDVEAGVLTLRHRGKALDVVRIDSIEDLRAVYRELQAGRLAYRTFVLDSLTELQKVSLRDIIGTKDIATLQDWGKNLDQVRRMIRLFRGLPIHFVCTALEMDIKDDETGAVWVRPSLPGKLSAEVSGFFDIVGRLSGKAVPQPDKSIKIERRLLVQQHGRYTAKDRSDALGVELVNPTLPHMLDAILASSEPKKTSKGA